MIQCPSVINKILSMILMKIQMRCFQRLHLSENHCCKREVCGFVSPFAIYTLHPLILGLVNICQSWLLDEAISGLKSSWQLR